MMNTVGYTREQFDQRNAEIAAARRKEQMLDEDEEVQSAGRKVHDAQMDLERLVASLRTIHDVDARLRYNRDLTAAKDAVTQAQQEYRQAVNGVYRRFRLHTLEEKRKEQEKQAQKLQSQQAKQAEAEAKEQFKQAYLASGGNVAQFESAWPALWQQELAERAKEQLTAAKHQLMQSANYSL